MQNDNNENIPDGQVKCFNCGAVHSVDDPRCPYCCALNPVGAGKAYMNELDDLKDETDQLAEDSCAAFSSRRKHMTMLTEDFPNRVHA